MRAVGVFAGINRDVLACFRFHTGLTVTARALRRIGIARLFCLAVDAFPKLFYFRAVTFGALPWCEPRRRSEFVHVAVAGRAGSCSEYTMRTMGHARRFCFMASGAFDLGDFRWMREVLDAGVAITATENSMRAVGVFAGINRDVLACFRFHTGLTVTGQARFVL